MSNVNICGVSPKQVNNGIYSGSSLSLIPVINLQHNPTTNDRNFPLFTFGRNGDETSADYGSIWYLSKFDGVTGDKPDAIWIKLSSGSIGPVIDFSVPSGTSPVVPDATGTVAYTSSAGTLAITGGTNTINFDLAGGGLGVDSFTVPSGTSPVVPDVNGNVAITAGTGITVTGGLNTYQIELSGGSTAIDSINVDNSSGGGTDPVVPDSNGQVTLTAAQVTNAGYSNVINVNSLAANSITLQIQQSGSDTVANTNKNGVCHFNSQYFNVDPTTAFVDLQGIYNTWTPTLVGAVAGSTTYVSQVGIYYKLGKFVFVNGYIEISAATGTGDATLGGLPFTVKNVANANPRGSINFSAAGWTWPVGRTSINVQGVLNSTTCLIPTSGTGVADANMQMANTAAIINFSLCYIAE